MMRGSEPRQPLCGSEQPCLFNLVSVGLGECGFIKTLDKHWTHPVSVCSALYFRGLRIVVALLQPHTLNICGNTL